MEYFRAPLTEQHSVTISKEMMLSSRIPKDLWNSELSKIPTSLAHKSPLDDYVRTLHQNERQGKSLYLHGPYGHGKSGAAAAIGKEVMRRGGRVIFFTAHEFDFVFGNKSEEKDYRKAILNTHFLILDDLGVEKDIPWSKPWVESIFKLRNNANLPTLVTSNDSLEELMGRIKSVASVIGGAYTSIKVQGHDWRMDGPPAIKEIKQEPVKKVETLEKKIEPYVILKQDQNLITYLCETYKINQSELARIVGTTPVAISNWKTCRTPMNETKKAYVLEKIEEWKIKNGKS